MAGEVRYRGKTYTCQELDEVRDLVARNPGASRWFLSKELCRKWNRVQANGALRDMLCRGLLLMLHREGLIILPPLKQAPTSHLRGRRTPLEYAVDTAPVAGSVAEVKPVTIAMVRRTPHEQPYKSLVRRYHYPGHTRPVGEHLEYIAFSHDRPLCVHGVLLGSPAYRGEGSASGMDERGAFGQPPQDRDQHPVSHPALDPCLSLGLISFGADGEEDIPGLGASLLPPDRLARDLRRPRERI